MSCLPGVVSLSLSLPSQWMTQPICLPPLPHLHPLSRLGPWHKVLLHTLPATQTIQDESVNGGESGKNSSALKEDTKHTALSISRDQNMAPTCMRRKTAPLSSGPRCLISGFSVAVACQRIITFKEPTAWATLSWPSHTSF